VGEDLAGEAVAASGRGAGVEVRVPASGCHLRASESLWFGLHLQTSGSRERPTERGDRVEEDRGRIASA
jgi:hypothetical protein